VSAIECNTSFPHGSTTAHAEIASVIALLLLPVARVEAEDCKPSLTEV
jgi:hypothetical protein